ncbi:MAG: APC family permease [Chloroflexi bacterium]|nr:APC family permease [Chloroflexota bacterium]
MSRATVPEQSVGADLVSERVAGGILPRVLNTFDMVAIFVAIVLFITNTTGFFNFGPVSMTYLVLGFLTFLIPGAIVTGQLGRLFPGEGSIYLWTHKAFGAFPSFLAGFAAWWPGILVMLATGTVVNTYLQTLTSRTFAPWVQGLIILAVIVASAVIASMRFRLTQNAVNAVFVLYGLGMLLMVLAGVIWLAQGHHSFTNFGSGWFQGLNHNPFDFNSSASTWSLFGFVILALLGIEVPLNMGVEVAEERAVTRYLIWGGVIVMVAYVAVNWALMVALPSSDGGNLGALALLVKASMGSFFEWVVGLIVIGFFVFITVVYNYSFARLLFVSGLDRRLPPAVSKVNSARVPYVAVIIQTVLAGLFTVGTYMIYPYIVSGNAADLASKAYYAFQAAVTVIWLLSMVFLFIDVLVIINRFKESFAERKIAHPIVFYVASVVGMLACAWGAIVTFTNPWAPQFGKGDWFTVVLALTVISLAFAPILYVIGRSVARGEALPPEAEAVVGART